MMKRNDGYTLAYVVVVLFVLASVALATMSLALIPAKNQKNAQLRMQEKYEAQGMIEQVVAVLERTTADSLTDEVLEELLTHTSECNGLIVDLNESSFNHINIEATVNSTTVTAELKLEKRTKTETTDSTDDKGNSITITTETIVGYTVKYLSYKTEVTP